MDNSQTPFRGNHKIIEEGKKKHLLINGLFGGVVPPAMGLPRPTSYGTGLTNFVSNLTINIREDRQSVSTFG